MSKMVGMFNFLLIGSCFGQFIVEFSGFNDRDNSCIGEK
jgi:hypothetical protein